MNNWDVCFPSLPALHTSLFGSKVERLSKMEEDFFRVGCGCEASEVLAGEAPAAAAAVAVRVGLYCCAACTDVMSRSRA